MVAEPAFRRATPEDAAGCARVLNAWIDATPWMPRCHDAADVERHYRDYVLKTRETTVAERDGAITGFLALDPAEGFVTALYLGDGERGRGTGKALLDKAKSRCRDGLSLWTFVQNTGAQRFYRREGFTEVRRTDGDNEEGLPDILFRWESGP